MASGKKLSKKTIKLIIAAVLVFIAAVAALSALGTVELSQLNSRSLMDWKLGGRIDFVRSAEDAKVYDVEHYKWFTDERGEGIAAKNADTRYYLGKYLGGYRVVGFSSSESYYSVLGIRVGDDELGAKTELLDSGYSILGGGFNSCRAHRGSVVVELSFERGLVTSIAAYIK